MANLLPSAERTELIAERRWRLIGAIATLVAGVALLGSIVLVPTLIVADASRDAGEEQLDTIRQLIDRQSDAGAVGEAVRIQKSISLLNLEQGTLPHETIVQIVGTLPAGVSLDALTWRRDGSVSKLDISGSAETRNALIAFGDALRATGMFGSVDIPLSSLAAQTDLAFKLSLEIKAR